MKGDSPGTPPLWSGHHVPPFISHFHTVVIKVDSGAGGPASHLGSASFGRGCILLGKLVDLSVPQFPHC